MAKGKYNKKPRIEILEYPKSVKGEHITAGDISNHFYKADSKIGIATIYRQIQMTIGRRMLIRL